MRVAERLVKMHITAGQRLYFLSPTPFSSHVVLCIFFDLLLIHLSVAEATSVVLFKRNPYDRQLLGDWGQAVGQLPE